MTGRVIITNNVSGFLGTLLFSRCGGARRSRSRTIRLERAAPTALARGARSKGRKCTAAARPRRPAGGRGAGARRVLTVVVSGHGAVRVSAAGRDVARRPLSVDCAPATTAAPPRTATSRSRCQQIQKQTISVGARGARGARGAHCAFSDRNHDHDRRRLTSLGAAAAGDAAGAHAHRNNRPLHRYDGLNNYL
ncbi:hypothetical protein EVAR_44435_1 [Eumeta japonica]|uniref:Uncharacterized protein n=1 Tax=Eumeta variegata TaxID=151549 RepID=A0A4C1WKT3_EUMVA|nr:hypothetical protein EVAR_44435_1 [Eumeta japonica]